ncbi:MAG: hypothetical protein NT178_04385 [Proteobacteria bacterium]|nr:hypothetical protein [Pseudomonadota bacterium]
MPRGDGTGPTGTGPMPGCKGIGRGTGAAGQGRMGGRALGAAGECLCPQCGERTPHEQGIPCSDQKCPKCGTAMVRG